MTKQELPWSSHSGLIPRSLACMKTSGFQRERERAFVSFEFELRASKTQIWRYTVVPCLESSSAIRLLQTFHMDKVHGFIIKFGPSYEEYVSDLLITFYANCKEQRILERFFDEKLHEHVDVWAALLSGFRGEDVRKTFLSHFLKELDRKLIIAFRDNEIEKSRSLDPELKQAIRDSRIAVVIFSRNYASSSWCLNELLEIVECKKDMSQFVIPIFYHLDPSDVRKQTGEFGEIFEKTCQNKTEDEKIRWRGALTDVANILGYHSVTWDNEASMIETITNDLLSKLHSSPSNEFEDLVGIKHHIIQMISLLNLESKEVKMVGIWGPSGIGKTTIARALFNRLSCQFQSSLFIDKAFISKSMEVNSRVDYNMKLHLQRTFLAELLDKKDIKFDHLGAIERMLRHRKALIFIDDLDDQDVLDALAGNNQWFGSGSRIVVVTEDKHFLRAHGIDTIYEVYLPSDELALEMFCRSAFRKNSPPDGFMTFASEVALLSGNLPLGLDVLGSLLRGRDKEDWTDMLPRLRNGLDGKIEKTLRISYDGLNNKEDAAIFRHIACLFDGETVNDIKLLLADSKLDVNIGLKNLVDKSLIHKTSNTVEMHSLLQEMGKEIVRSQSNEPGEREFLTDSEDICHVLEDNTGTKKILGLALDMDKTDGVHIHESAFKRMHNLLFLKLYAKLWNPEKEVRWGFDQFPSKLRLLRWVKYPMRCMPSNFRPENLVKLQMPWSNLEKLWEGVHPITGLKHMDLWGSENLKEIPNLSMATNLETLNLNCCSSLVELPCSIQYLNKLIELDMYNCKSLETLPAGINLKSLYRLDLNGCSLLRRFPDISTNISELGIVGTAIEEIPSNLRLENLLDLKIGSRVESEKLWGGVQPLTPFFMTIAMLSPSLTILMLSDIPSLVELPSSIQNFYQLEELSIVCCVNLETLPSGINLNSLDRLDLSGCSRLKTFPDISRNVSELFLDDTAVEEVPWWIENLSNLCQLDMNGCNDLLRVSFNIFKLKRLGRAGFSDCRALTEASFHDSPSELAMGIDNIHPNLQAHDKASSSLPVDYIPVLKLDFINSFNFDPKALIQQQMRSTELIMLGEEVPSYFTHRTTGNSLTNITLPHTSASQPFFSCWCCAVVDVESIPRPYTSFKIQVSCQLLVLSFAGRLQLISSVIYSTVNFWMGAFILPKACIKEIERMCNRYLWNGNIYKKGGIKVAWSKVCLPKREGGLGLRDMRIWNKVLHQALFIRCLLVSNQNFRFLDQFLFNDFDILLIVVFFFSKD